MMPPEMMLLLNCRFPFPWIGVVVGRALDAGEFSDLLLKKQACRRVCGCKPCLTGGRILLPLPAKNLALPFGVGEGGGDLRETIVAPSGLRYACVTAVFLLLKLGSVHVFRVT
jgi:hypothetical protein